MADSKITALDNLTSADPANDMIPIVDVSATPPASGNTKRISINNLLACSPSATLASATITGAATVGTTLGVTGVSTFAAGTALLPALTTTGDTNTGIYYPAADTFAVTTGGVERYRVDSTGLGIGAVPTDAFTLFGKASISSANPDVNALKLTANTGTNAVAINFANTGGNYFVGVDNSVGGRLYGVPYSLCIGSNGAYPVVIATNNTARLTVDATGNVGIGIGTFGTSAAKVLGLANATAPSTSPAGMGQLYVESGALKFRGSSGTITTIAAA